MSYIYVIFCMYANHVCVSHTVKINHEGECDLPSTIHTTSIFGKSFSFGEEHIGTIYYHDLAYACA
jgi:hypothetical protein